MKLGLMVAGALAGYLADASSFWGLLVGAGVGFLLGQVRELTERLALLERRQSERRAAAEVAPLERSEAASRQPVGSPDPPEPSVPPGLPDVAAAKAAPPEPVELPEAEPVASEPTPTGPSVVERALQATREWLTTGNVPVKVGVVVSFFGVAFLLKYSIDRELLTVPIEVRLLLVAAAAIGLLTVGWRLRESSRVYGLSLQGGGIGVLYLTIFAAFRLYDLLPALGAFILLVALTAFAGFIAVLQNARALAVLGTVGGFLAPVLVSTGGGNHVALFGYYLILNLAILGIARFRTWRELNLLGFVFTFVIGALWGRDDYRPELFASTEPFLIAHFLLYQAVAVMFALRQPVKLRGIVDGTLVFGTPVVAFALQSRLVRDTEYGLAISAVVLAVFYAVLARWLWGRHRESLRLMTESYLALAVAFATLAIPLALDARWSAASWALEGVALVWIGARQNRALAKVTGLALLLLAGGSFAVGGWRSGEGLPVLNGNLLGGLLIGGSAWLAARILSAERRTGPTGGLQMGAAIFLLIWGAGWWLGSGACEIGDRASGVAENHLLIVWISLSCLASALLGRWRDWPLARAASLSHLPLLIVGAVLYGFAGHQPFAGWGALCWLGALLVHLVILSSNDRLKGRAASGWHAASLLSLATLLAWQVYRLVDPLLGPVWAAGGACLVPAMFVGGILALGTSSRWPMGNHRAAYRGSAGALALAGLVAVWFAVSTSAGDPAPLPYLPLLNPFDIVTLAALLTALWWLVTIRRDDEILGPSRWNLGLIAWAVAAFGLTTAAVVRAVVQIAELEWRAGGVLGLVAVQAALSIYWGLLGVAGMVLGARRRQRGLWLVGAGLMGVVVAKLFLVDLGNTETLARIVSFIGVGALLLVVGYFAPAPPREFEEGES